MLEIPADDKIVLRSVELRDADDLFPLTDASRQYLREWLPWVDSTRTVDDTRAFVDSALEQQANNDGFHCTIWYEEKLVGMIGLGHIDWANRKTEIGYWLGEEFQGNGIMTKSCQSLVSYLFDEIELNRVTIRVAVGNKRSRAIPERLGFVEEGTIRDAEWLYDHYVDSVIYGLLQRDIPNEHAS
ncbi:MAG: GNAT family N-acetyltransferase [Anaerolineales bacterium]